MKPGYLDSAAQRVEYVPRHLGRERAMQRRQVRTAVLIAGLVCAMAALASSSWGAAPRRYVLRHPKREHCKAHYKKRVVTVKKRVHGHTRKVRETVCIRRHRKKAPIAASPHTATLEPLPTLVPIALPTRPPRPRQSREPKSPEPIGPTCTSIFTGMADQSWSTAANWTGGIPSGFLSYGCIPSGYPKTVIYSMTAETPTELGGVSAENAEGITLQDGHLTLANPEQHSRINNVKPGGAAVALDEGVILELTGTTGELGGNEWDGPGALEIPQGAILRTGECAGWEGSNESKCVDGTPTPGHGGLQVKNLGEMFGAGISLCRNGAAQPAKLENEGNMHLRLSAGFEGASDCGEVGSVVNGIRGRLGIAENDGNGCNVRVGVASLRNKGAIRLGSCFQPETEQVRRATLEIGSSLSEAGSIYTAGIVHIQGNYTPTATSTLTISIRQTFPRGSPETNYGAVKVSGSATLAGELNIATDRFEKYPPALGQTFQILDVGEVAGSLSGEFTLGSRCIPTEPGNGYRVDYNFGSKGTVTLEVAKVPGC
jgi:hypothetical protein